MPSYKEKLRSYQKHYLDQFDIDYQLKWDNILKPLINEGKTTFEVTNSRLIEEFNSLENVKLAILWLRREGVYVEPKRICISYMYGNYNDGYYISLDG